MNAVHGLHSLATSDGELAYRDTGGTGRPVVLLHAGYVDHTMWDAQIPVLAREFRVVAPDARGHGRSANASRPFRQVDDLADLLRHLDTGPAVLVGVSMGATIAVGTALEHPGLVRALVVSGGGGDAREFTEPWSQQAQAAQFEALAAGDIERWQDTSDSWVHGPERPRDAVRSETYAKLRAMRLRTIGKHTLDEPDHHIPVRDLDARADRIAVPVLALNGAQDAPELRALAESVARTAPRGRMTAIDDAAHFPNLDHPDEYTRIVTDFVRGLDR
ncbi:MULTISPECIES: alpha/beta fold hydrolase [unclassified Streptomyces]|uniref:alpha/beta fold hydrolase n=1 Tax=unclassified Streptomyces TaxID=2593676 RepID=UPI0011CEA555|nr:MULTISPECIES: alpha/beta hydrolase [unclassified Streptomyces]TXS61139.1 alpha/beta hydrolase [Streptomyces sp. me109]